mmetsp:Transcript_73716/g.116748  ORF Transcript_73716/g.116748 Transcript_73716/m.116748 type:complete len:887 (+) Transcript_73716:103-2763(+)
MAMKHPMALLLLALSFPLVRSSANLALPTYTVDLSQLTSSGVFGEVTLFTTPTGILGVGTAMGLEANLSAAPAGTDCLANNGCGVHVHSGTSCTNSSTQGGHYFGASPDPWSSIRYANTDSNGSAAFAFHVTTDSTSIDGKPFILHNNAGARVACGIIARVYDIQAGNLTALSNSGVAGSVTIRSSGSLIAGAGLTSGLEANLSDASNGGTDCTATNGCGVHVHSGFSCANSSVQEGHLKSLAGLDPWTQIRYSRTSGIGDALFVFAVRTDNALVTGRAFIVHDNSGARVACGILTDAPMSSTTPTTATATTTTTTLASFSSYLVYEATIAELGGSGVSGDIAIFVTPTGLFGAGRASGLERGLVAGAAVGSHCTATNACGIHVHSGTACTDANTQGGHYFMEASDPWTNTRYSNTDSVGDAIFSFSVATMSTAIEGKPFIVHDNAGARVACGILSFVRNSRSARLSALSNSGVVGSVTIHTTAGLIAGAGWANGLEFDLAGPSTGGSDCVEKNGCGVHVHSGSTCDNTVGQGGHLTTIGGFDPWRSVAYSSTSSSGFAHFTFAVKSDNTDVTGKPFVVHSNAGDRVSCGLLLSTSSVYFADLTQLGNSGVSGRVTMTIGPNGLVGVGSARGLEPYLVLGPDCNLPNACGVHVHSGSDCNNSSVQGGHYYSTSSDPWLPVKYTSTDSEGTASFTFTVMTGISEIKDKPFILHNNAGERVACGILSLLAQSEQVDDQTNATSKSDMGVVISLGLGGGAVLIFCIVLCCLRWYCCRGQAKAENGIVKDTESRSLSFHEVQRETSPSQCSSFERKPNDEEDLRVRSAACLCVENEEANASFTPTSQPELSSRHHERTNALPSQSSSLWHREDHKSWYSEESALEGAFEV